MPAATQPPPPVWTPGATNAALVVACVLFGSVLYRAWGVVERPRGDMPILRAVDANDRLDLNAANESLLAAVPGVGKTLAARVVEDREANGPYEHVEDLRRVKGIGPATLTKLSRHLAVYDDGLPKPPKAAPPPAKAAPPPDANPWGDAARKKPLTAAVDVNTCPAEDLTALPGVGPTLASRIDAYRKERPFADVDELRRVKGIGAKTLEKIRPWVKVGGKK